MKSRPASQIFTYAKLQTDRVVSSPTSLPALKLSSSV